MNLANKLTIARILLIPLFLIFIAFRNIPYGSYIATFIFILASITDSLDGYVARSRNQVTTLGKFMDPLADKLLVTAALISLVELKIVPAWVVVIILTREFAVTGLRSVAATEGIVISASNWGKVKTISQIVAIILGLMTVNTNFEILETLTMVALGIAVILTVISGIDYFNKNLKVLKEK
ncbi:CDP-diacylglycerol--glycerol-3-phosphate 3-phosphatidyltransferase [Clostridium cellulovorans]|uniref:CDP-diacylglycerol--glycerol-3-phosphate 3-phosphatidyltransferase n=1 Tax=Clostridium cellulovorans (strain ATCC 35296 / DSM 3052 / OCM 3 / 743B) TaxID=573061 RepID=D9SMU0_CLOC7|nr:CDP-diacylglycerol--glycerol-3-phosphate 3-phosphatidyltransferase [Clostridium cellulovorans]ADL51806.1 CDP-diacylglycerol/glycerol-3-phosphate 3-phosphatidyltransferase [Clostridium cellulovorans 743B]